MELTVRQSKIKLPGWRDDVAASSEEHVEDEVLPDASLGFVGT